MIAHMVDILSPKCIRVWFTDTFTALDYFLLFT